MIAALALALVLGADPRTELALSCERCFGMEVDLDGEHLLHVEGLGGASVQDGKLGASREAALHALPPGLHHLKVVVFTTPLNPYTWYDGPVFLRPGAKMRLRVKQGALEDLAPPAPTSAPAGSLPDAGAPPLAPASLVARADDDGNCAIAVDGAPRATLHTERVVEIAPLAPGLHQLEVRTLQGATLVRGTLYLGAGERAVAGVRCQKGQVAVDSDPRAFSPQPGESAAPGQPYQK